MLVREGYQQKVLNRIECKKDTGNKEVPAESLLHSTRRLDSKRELLERMLEREEYQQKLLSTKEFKRDAGEAAGNKKVPAETLLHSTRKF